jgi:hypothetical protein
MLDATNKIKFFRDGLVHYPDARETVDYFQTSAMEAIFGAFEAANWKNFKPHRDSEGSLQSARATGPVDRYIQASIDGTLANRNRGKETVTLYLFLWWNPPLRPKAQVVAACVAWDEKRPVQLLDLPDRDQRVVLGLVKKKGELCLLLEPTKDFDPAEAFPLLLHSIDEAMGGR